MVTKPLSSGSHHMPNGNCGAIDGLAAG